MAINLTDSDALERLKEKLKNLTKLQEMMKAVNIIIRNKKIPAEEKTKLIQERYHLTPDCIRELISPKESWEQPGFPSWQLSNNNQEINRVRKRIQEVVDYQKAVAQTEEAGVLPEFPFEGGKIVDNIPMNRIQIFFDGKPNAEVRQKLKSNAFRWAPSNAAWQSYRNRHTLNWAKEEFKAVTESKQTKEEEIA